MGNHSRRTHEVLKQSEANLIPEDLYEFRTNP